MFNKYKIGNAIDHHKLIEEKTKIKLAGIAFDSDYGILAHSDGDVILHAISNAILNSLGLNDIGTYFKDTDSKNKNMDSLKILDFALVQMNERGYKINNISIVLESDYIFLLPKKELILSNLKKILNTPNVSIHGTRTEQNLKIISAYVTILITSF